MAKDPVCGMFVEEKNDSIRHKSAEKEYYFCSTQCLSDFTQPEKELHKLKMHVIISIILTIPITLLTLPHMLSGQKHGISNYSELTVIAAPASIGSMSGCLASLRPNFLFLREEFKISMSVLPALSIQYLLFEINKPHRRNNR